MLDILTVIARKYAKIAESTEESMARRKANSGTHGTPTPHDLAFKQFLTHPDTARDFMQLHLPAELVRELAQRVPQHEDQLMTIAQQLEQKGIEKGLMLGEQRGIEKGKLEVARTMLQNGLDRDTIIKLTGLTADELANIRH